MRAGRLERGYVLSGAEPGIGRRRRVRGHRGPDDGRGHGDHDEREDQQLLTPLPAEEPPRPADHRAAGRERHRSPGRFSAGRSSSGTLIGSDPGWSSDSGALRRHGLVDDAPVPQEHDPVGPGGELRVVGDDDRGHAPVAGGENHAHHGLAVDRIQCARRLVGEEQVPIADDGAGDRNPLALAAGELVGIVRGPVRESELLEGGHPGGMGLPGPTCRRARAAGRRSPPRSGRASRLKSWKT